MKDLKLSALGARPLRRAARWCVLSGVAASPLLVMPLACAQVNSTQEVVSLTASQAPVTQEFVFKAERPLKSVAVAGTFNKWSSNANQLVADADGLTWRVTLPLEYGKQLYKFVLDGTEWMVDPRAATNETDTSGNTNSVLVLLPPDYKTPAKPNDGVIATSALRHESRAPHVNYDQGQLSLSLRVRPGDVRQVFLRVGDRRVPMRLASSDELYAHYRAAVPWNRKDNLVYSFELVDGAQTRRFGADGLKSKPQPFRIVASEYEPFVVPDWVERTVFYQIFPDRFANGDKTNDPPDVQPWDITPTWFNRTGGDAAGVRQHVDYLANLGVSGVYFNPVFQAPSNHRYDAENFHKIDAQFGTNSEFAALTKELQNKNIRTVMDFVFNHTATTFPPFMDVREKGKASPYDDWYFIKSYPVEVKDPPNYVAWWNYPSMPKLNLLNPETSDYMLDLVNFWKKEVPLSGLRLDVANEVDMGFWRRLRERVKGLDEQMWIVGEVWDDASPWLGGDQWDAAMNYPFLFANAAFFAEKNATATQFAARLMENYAKYPPQVSRNMMNLLSSHDTPRFLTRCNGDERLHQLAATIQFTWVGAPSIYYGEEIGMEGGADPDNRRPMQWDKVTPENEMLRFYKRLIEIRDQNRVLQSGEPQILLTDDAAQSLVYARTLEDDVAIVAVNRSNAPQKLSLTLTPEVLTRKVRSGGFRDALGGRNFKIESGNRLVLELAPLSSAILLPANR